MIAAIIPAAGSGERFGRDDDGKAKQFLQLAGKPLYLWSLKEFCSNDRISQIVLLVPSADLEAVKLETAQLSKVSVITGGASRQKSVVKGLNFLCQSQPQPEYVLVHDAARPMLSQKMIQDSIDAVTEFGACTLAIPVSDTIKKTIEGTVSETVDRSQLVQIQTPQAAKFTWLLEAHEKAIADNLSTTDDSTILQHNGHKVHIVPGSAYNLKITNPEDLLICQSLIFSQSANGLQAAI
jgi:2-C-methyl-D-erythritol 4-phosphate cytidylyltransferase